MLALPNEVDFAKLLLLKCAEQTCMFKDAVNSFPPNSNNSCFPSHWVWRKTVKWQERSIARAIWTQRHRTVIAIFTKFKTLGRRSTVDVTGDLEKHWPTKTHLPPKAKKKQSSWSMHYVPTCNHMVDQPSDSIFSPFSLVTRWCETRIFPVTNAGCELVQNLIKTKLRVHLLQGGLDMLM